MLCCCSLFLFFYRSDRSSFFVPLYLLSFPPFVSTSPSLLSTLRSCHYFHPHPHQHTNTQQQQLVMAPPPSSEPQEANDTPYQLPPPSASTTPATTYSEQLATQVKPPLAKTYSSTNSIPQSTTPTTTSGAQGGGGTGGFLTTVRNAATDILGISLPASAPTTGGEADPNGIGNSNSNNNSNNSNGDINVTETVVSGVGDDARRNGNASGDGKLLFFYFSVLCSVQYNNVYGVTCSFLAEGAYSWLIPGNH